VSWSAFVSPVISNIAQARPGLYVTATTRSPRSTPARPPVSALSFLVSAAEASTIFGATTKPELPRKVMIVSGAPPTPS
jgi:hypothetical protein